MTRNLILKMQFRVQTQTVCCVFVHIYGDPFAFSFTVFYFLTFCDLSSSLQYICGKLEQDRQRLASAFGDE